jgi:hypothetical protein
MEIKIYEYKYKKNARNKVNDILNKYGYKPGIQTIGKQFEIHIPKNLLRIDI